MTRWGKHLGATLFISFRTALAQVTHNITVGDQGSFYNPRSVFAAVNDTVNFIFLDDVHSVIQAAFANPCFPLPGGFSSGIVRAANNSNTVIWTLTITNTSNPIWFYCGNIIPLSHCASGMVGAINPPSDSIFEQYWETAKRVSAPVPTTLSLSLTGQGAFATRAPGPVLIPTSSQPTSSAPTLPPTRSQSSPVESEVLTPTSPAPTATSSSKKGAIIGGSVAGGVVFLAILAFIISFFFRRRNARHRRSSKDFFRYKAATPQFNTPSDATFSPSKFVSSPSSKPRQTQQLPTNQTTSTTPHSTPASLVPATAAAAEPSQQQQHQHQHQHGRSPGMRASSNLPSANTQNARSNSVTRATPTRQTSNSSNMGSPPLRRLPTPTTQSSALPPAAPPPTSPPPRAPRPLPPHGARSNSQPTSPPQPPPPFLPGSNPSSPPLDPDKKLPLTNSESTAPPPPAAGDHDTMNQTNIQMLAREVAAVLMQRGQGGVVGGGGGGGENRNRDRVSSTGDSLIGAESSPPPPRYRAL